VTVLDFFTAHPVFSREEFVRFLAGRGAPSVETANVHLKRYLAAGRIGRVKRGVYFAAGPGETAARAALDFPLVASRLTLSWRTTPRWKRTDTPRASLSGCIF
jgi:hypothetical protein